MKKLITQNQIDGIVQTLRKNKQKIVFTNGCFDIVHLGHIKLLEKCKQFGTVILALNSDNSIKRLKGESRPINNTEYRAEFLSHFSYVDYIVVFEEDTPINLIEQISPDYLIKGGDYIPEKLVGYSHVKSYGGEVLTFDFNIKQSTTNILACQKRQNHD